MKKLMALCLSLLMALSMVSFSVMAEEEAPVLAAVFSDIANSQPQDFVTGNLVLGENDVITSSNEAVIALDGTVTRPIFEDATVTITINGGAPLDVKVKAKTVNVLYANDFSEDKGTGWVLTLRDDNDPCEVKDGVFKSVIGGTAKGRTWMEFYPSVTSSTMPVTIEFDMSNITGLASAGADLRISGNRYDAAGNKIGSFATITVARCSTTSGFGTYWFSKTSKNVSLKYNPATGEVWGNGALCANNLKTCTDTNFSYSAGKSAEDCAKVVITMVGITNAAGGCTATFDMDDFVQYQEVSAETALATATPAEKLANYSKYIDKAYVANGASFNALTSNLRFTADETLPEDVSLSWTTSDASVITSAGVIKRSALETKTATITGTLAVGEESISKTYNVTVLPLTVAGQSEIVDIDNFGSVSSFSAAANVVKAAVKEGDNSAVSFDLVKDFYDSAVVSYNFTNLPSIAGAKELVMSFKLKTENHVHAGSDNVTNYGFKVNGKEIAEFTYYGKTLRPNGTYNGAAATNGWHSSSSTGVTYDTNSANYAELKIVIDLATKTAKHYLNGNRIGTTNVGIGLASVDSITSLGFYVSDRHSKATVYLDDIQVQALTDASTALANLPAEDKVAFVKDAIAASNIGAVAKVGDALDLDNGYASYDLAKMGVNVAWASDNAEYISNAGEAVKLASFVTRTDVTMTATITAGEVSDTVALTVAAPDGTQMARSMDFTDTSISVGKATYEVDEDPAHGSVIHVSNPTVGGHKSSDNITYIDPAGSWTGRFVLSADLKYINGNSASSGGIIFKTIAGYDGIIIRFSFETNKIILATTVPYAYADGTKAMVDSARNYYIQMPNDLLNKEGEWFNVTVDFNALSQTYVLYVDGTRITELPMLQSNMKIASNGGGSVRGFSLECSNKGELWADNVTVRKFTDTTANEVNAALNAAIIDFGSEYNKPVLTNGALPAYTISKAWNNSAQTFDRDLDESGNIKASNVSTYKYMADGPQITWTVDGVAATEINVDSPKVATITVTATKDGVSESKTFQRKVAPAAIYGLGVNGNDAFNGIWLDANAETDKVVIAQYDGTQLVSARVITLKDNENFNAETGILKNIAILPPAGSAATTALKVFIVAEDGITPLAYANTELHD